MPFDRSMAGIARRRWLGVAAAILVVALGAFWFISKPLRKTSHASASAPLMPSPKTETVREPLKPAASVAANSDWASTAAGRRLISALQLQGSARLPAVTAALEELSKDPADALAAGRQLLAQEPQNAADFGTVLIGALTRTGEYSTAFELASSCGPSASRGDWMAIVLNSWVRREPGVGPELAAVLMRQGVQGNVFNSLVQGWAESAPEKLADYALTLPEGGNRSVAFNAALDRWILRDPLSAAQWIGTNLTHTPDFDHALSTLLAHTDDLFTSTETALEWTEGINDPNLRLSALTHVLQQWAQRDPAGALRYAQSAEALDPAQREKLIASLTPKPPAD